MKALFPTALLAIMITSVPNHRGALLAQTGSDANTVVSPALFEGLEFRNVGPSRGGRVTTVTGHADQPSTFYFGSTGGGVWKTTDYGRNWHRRCKGRIDRAVDGSACPGLSQSLLLALRGDGAHPNHDGGARDSRIAETREPPKASSLDPADRSPTN